MRYVSSGRLPEAGHVRALVDDALARFGTNDAGAVSDVYPALARVARELFGICVVGTDGSSYEAGDDRHPFPIMSVSKPFVFALICQALGPREVRERIGVNATGLPFDSLAAVESGRTGRTNPMVNAGAIATTSLVPGGSHEERWRFLLEGLSRFAGRQLELDREVYASASTTNHRNRSIAWLLESKASLWLDPTEALDLYTRQSSLRVTALDLAVMGATLADGGVNPLSKVRVVDEESCRHTLVVMATAGLYEASGDWLYEIGLPGKSGIGGGIIAVSPGKGAIGTFAPLLDGAGNSIKGQLTAAYLARGLGLDLFASVPFPAR